MGVLKGKGEREMTSTERLRNLYINRHGQFSVCCNAAGIHGSDAQDQAAKMWNKWVDIDTQLGHDPRPAILKAYDPDEWRR